MTEQDADVVSVNVTAWLHHNIYLFDNDFNRGGLLGVCGNWFSLELPSFPGGPVRITMLNGHLGEDPRVTGKRLTFCTNPRNNNTVSFRCTYVPENFQQRIRRVWK